MTFQPGDPVDRTLVDDDVRRALARDLRDVVRGDVQFDDATRGIYATDSSNYRQKGLSISVP